MTLTVVIFERVARLSNGLVTSFFKLKVYLRIKLKCYTDGLSIKIS